MLKGTTFLIAAFFLAPAWAQEKDEPKRVIEEHQESHESAKRAVDDQEELEDMQRAREGREGEPRDESPQHKKGQKERNES